MHWCGRLADIACSLLSIFRFCRFSRSHTIHMHSDKLYFHFEMIFVQGFGVRQQPLCVQCVQCARNSFEHSHMGALAPNVPRVACVCMSVCCFHSSNLVVHLTHINMLNNDLVRSFTMSICFFARAYMIWSSFTERALAAYCREKGRALVSLAARPYTSLHRLLARQHICTPRSKRNGTFRHNRCEAQPPRKRSKHRCPTSSVSG